MVFLLAVAFSLAYLRAGGIRASVLGPHLTTFSFKSFPFSSAILCQTPIWLGFLNSSTDRYRVPKLQTYLLVIV